MQLSYIDPIHLTVLCHITSIKPDMACIVIAITNDITTKGAFPLSAVSLEQITFTFFENGIVTPDVRLKVFAMGEHLGKDIVKFDGVHGRNYLGSEGVEE